MILISHRGNINGKLESYENDPNYIDLALSKEFDVEVDVWMIDGILFLGHDGPRYGVSMEWFNDRNSKLWIHCKNVEAMEWFNTMGGFNYFWHDGDLMTLTSQSYIWANINSQPIKESIAVLPEQTPKLDLSQCKGICSDFISLYSFS